MGSRILLALRKDMKPVRVPQHDPLAAAFDEALTLPRAEDPADGMQRRTGHFGDVPAADREVDLDARFDFSPGLFRQPKQSVSDALLDLLVGNLDHSGLRVL